MIKQIFSIAVAATFTISSLAYAGVEAKAADESKVTITYDLKDIFTDSGRKELEHQIHLAADKVCGPRTVGQAGSLAQSRHNRACYKDAVASAMKSVDDKSVSIAAVSSN
jgi:UrcA family protein